MKLLKYFKSTFKITKSFIIKNLTIIDIISKQTPTTRYKSPSVLHFNQDEDYKS